MTNLAPLYGAADRHTYIHIYIHNPLRNNHIIMHLLVLLNRFGEQNINVLLLLIFLNS